MKKILSTFREDRNRDIQPISEGLFGYFSYDSVRYFEKLPDLKPDRLKLPDIKLVLPKILIAFDHIKQKLVFVAHSYSPTDTNEAIRLIDKYEMKLNDAKNPGRLAAASRETLQLTAHFRKEDFLAAVEKAKRHIVAGDIFQVVLSQRFATKTEIPPFDIYRKLRMINPSPYMFYMDFEDFQLVGSSPEVMVKRSKNAGIRQVVVRPIAGRGLAARIVRGHAHRKGFVIRHEGIGGAHDAPRPCA